MPNVERHLGVTINLEEALGPDGALAAAQRGRLD